VYGGEIRTLDPSVPCAEAMVVRGAAVLALGPRAELEAAWGKAAGRLDLEGRAVIPGLTDSHLHLLSAGLAMDQLELGGCPSLVRLTELVGEAARGLPAGEWLVGRGWDQDLFTEHRYPTRNDLDPVSGGHPACLTRCCGHCSVANSRALALAGIGAGTTDPPGGRIDRDPGTGEPTGVLWEAAGGLLRAAIPVPSYETKRRALERAMRLALSKGLVAVYPDDVRSAGDLETAWRLYEELLPATGGPRVRLDVSWQAVDELLRAGLRTGSGDGMLSIGSAKLFADGSLGARTAALTEPYADDPAQRGILVHERDEFEALVAGAHERGMQVAIHAIGDLGVEWSLTAIERAQRAARRGDLRHRIVHAQVLRPDQPRRFARLGVVADIQPKFVGTDKLWVESRLGADRSRTSYCWRTLLKAGVRCAGGSDCPVEPLDPLLGLHAAVTRQDLKGEPDGGWQPQEKLDVDAALRLFALGGPYAANAEEQRGALSRGRAADFVVLDRSPYAVAPEELKDLRVVMTYVAGRRVYEA
jgi:hypothetical protein